MTHNYNLRNLSSRNKENDKIYRFFDTYREYIEKQNSIVEIKLKLLNGNKYDFTVNKNMTIRELYIKTSYITNINCISYFFVKNHYRLPKFEEIEDWMTLKDFNFKPNETNQLHLVLRLGGPMKPFKYNKEEWF